MPMRRTSTRSPSAASIDSETPAMASVDAPAAANTPSALPNFTIVKAGMAPLAVPLVLRTSWFIDQGSLDRLLRDVSHGLRCGDGDAELRLLGDVLLRGGRQVARAVGVDRGVGLRPRCVAQPFGRGADVLLEALEIALGVVEGPFLLRRIEATVLQRLVDQLAGLAGVLSLERVLQRHVRFHR